MKKFEFSLQLKGEENKVIGNIVQNDTANLFIIRLKDGITPFQLADTDIVTVTYKRGNDTVVVDSVGGETVTVTDCDMGEISVIPHSSAVVNVGMITATVEVYDGIGRKLTSARFSFTVTPDAAAQADASTSDEFPALQNLISYTAQKNTEFETAERQRVQNEEQRISNEGQRIDSEAVREANEEERQKTHEEMKTLIEEGEKLVSMDVSVVTDTDTEYVLEITDKDGKFKTPNLKGKAGMGSGDMLREVYDTDGNGVVDNAEKLGGHSADYFMPTAGGTFTGETAHNAGYGHLYRINDDTYVRLIGVGDYFYLQLWNSTGWVKNLMTFDENGNCTEGELMPKSGGTFTGEVILSGAPTADLHPSTKKYVDTHTTSTSNPHSVTKSQIGLSNVTNNKQMPIAGGTFTGNAVAYSTNRTTSGLRNIEVRTTSATGTLQSTNKIIMVRK